ncbi:hypothetical protein ACHAXH_007243 [Discostella pseudostelligera]
MAPHSPPPPGFACTPSSSFHNLALALGTGLAESMNDCLSNDDDDQQHHHHHRTTTTNHQQLHVNVSSSHHRHENENTLPSNQITMNGDEASSSTTGVILGLPRIHTPDTYARQSRHSVNRLVSTPGAGRIVMQGLGGGSAGGGGFGIGGMLGLDYLTTATTTTNPATTAIMWNRNQQQHPQQRQQSLAVEKECNNLNNNQSNTTSKGFDDNDNFGKPLLFSSQTTRNDVDIFTASGSNSSAHNSNSSINGSNNRGLMQNNSNSARYTAAVMAKNLENGSGGVGNGFGSGVGTGSGQGKLLFGNIQEWTIDDPPTATAPSASTASTNVSSFNNTNSVGLTVVEPSSNRNSPALPHPPSRSGDCASGGISSACGGGGGGGDTAAAILGDKGLFYQSWQRQLQQRFMLSPSVVVVGGGGGSAGGRASAPPPQSRFLPSILTIGGGGLVVGGGGGGDASGTSTPDLLSSKQGNVITNNSNLRSSTPVFSTIVSVTPIPDPANNRMNNPDSHILLPTNHRATVGMKNVVTSSSTTVPSSGSYDRGELDMELSAVRDLAPFLRGPSSSGDGAGPSSALFNDVNGGTGSVSTRGLAILHASSIRCHDVRSTCEAFGALETFRSDFGESRGVFFATYYDLRNAQLAVVELPKVLNKLRNNGVAEGGVVVKYCVSLNSSSATDESMLLLSNLPCSVDEYELSQTLSSFGEVRTIQYQANASHGEVEGNESASYLVEFYDIQDAKQALLELEHVHPWGDFAKIEIGTRSPTKRKLGKELILLLSSWRQGKGGGSPKNGQRQQAQGGDSVRSTVSTTHTTPSPPQPDGSLFTGDNARSNHDDHHQPSVRAGDIYHQNNIQQFMPMGESSQHQPQSYYQYPNFQHVAENNQQQYQLVVGPDGQYSYVLLNPQMIGPHYGHAGQPMMFDPHNLQHQVPNQHHYIHNPHHLLSQVAPSQQYHAQYNVPAMLLRPGLDYLQDMVPSDAGAAAANGFYPPTQFIRMPSYDTSSLSNNGGQLSAGTCGFSAASSGSGSPSENNSGGATSCTNREDESDGSTNLTLSIDNVCTGKDCRSSLMVRNIPNKYTQQMLLSEFADAGHGPDKMDFFYLPIDFKNKCNRGYAFVNFVNYKDIIPFVSEYNHRGWKRFNSDKICDITYARIQGKAAMWKRFENSALMAKDDEFRPKVFVSHGEKKGQVENIIPMTTREVV